MTPSPSPPPVSTLGTSAFSAGLCLVLLLGLLGAVRQDQVRPMEGSVIFVLGCLTVAFASGFTTTVRRGEWPRLETSWGGLGGGLGGWRISPALAWLLGALLFGSAFTFTTLSAAGLERASAAAIPAHTTIAEVPSTSEAR